MKKNIIFKSFIIISIFFLIYITFKSEITWKGTRREYYSVYQYFFILIILFSILSLFISENLKNYILVTLFSFVFSIYLFETFLFFNYAELRDQKKKIKTYKLKTGKDYDTRGKIEIYKDLKITSKNTKIAVPPFLYYHEENELFPLSGISNAETVVCNENGYYFIFKSDRYGFNNPDKEWDNENIEYILVGDSFTMGQCVNRPNDIASVLRKLSKSSVLNLGYGGNGPLLQYATLREYLKPGTKYVLWLFFEGNDILDLNNELSSKILNRYLKDKNFSQNLKSNQSNLNKLTNYRIQKSLITSSSDRLKDDLKEKSINLIVFLKIHKTRDILHRLLPEKYGTVVHPEFKEVLKKTKILSEENGSELYFVYIPDYYSSKNTFYKASTYSFIKNILIELKIPFIDIPKKVLAKEENVFDLYPFGDDGHFNVLGYRKVAEEIYKSTSN